MLELPCALGYTESVMLKYAGEQGVHLIMIIHWWNLAGIDTAFRQQKLYKVTSTRRLLTYSDGLFNWCMKKTTGLASPTGGPTRGQFRVRV